MKKIILTCIMIVTLVGSAMSQQNPMFTKYMFNSLVYNPAYAGSKDYLSAAALHRDQWWGLEGAPKTQTFTIHSPLEDPRVGLGLSFYNDVIGPTNQLYLSTSYAYRLIFNQNQTNESKLSFGLQASIANWKPDWSKLNLQNPTDVAFMESTNVGWLPNFGAGVFYYSDKFYLGFSVPNVLKQELRTSTGVNDTLLSSQYRHYFLAGGVAFELGSPDLVFKPSFVIKNTNLFGEFDIDPGFASTVGAPTEIDLDASVLFFKTLWVGASFRTAFEALNANAESSIDSADIWAAYYLRNGFRIGVAFDWTWKADIRQAAIGSFEIMVGYDANFSGSKIVTPRYF